MHSVKPVSRSLLSWVGANCYQLSKHNFLLMRTMRHNFTSLGVTSTLQN